MMHAPSLPSSWIAGGASTAQITWTMVSCSFFTTGASHPSAWRLEEWASLPLWLLAVFWFIWTSLYFSSLKRWFQYRVGSTVENRLSKCCDQPHFPPLLCNCIPKWLQLLWQNPGVGWWQIWQVCSSFPRLWHSSQSTKNEKWRSTIEITAAGKRGYTSAKKWS